MNPNQKEDQSILNFKNAVSIEKLEERLEMTALAADSASCSTSYTCSLVIGRES